MFKEKQCHVPTVDCNSFRIGLSLDYHHLLILLDTAINNPHHPHNGLFLFESSGGSVRFHVPAERNGPHRPGQHALRLWGPHVLQSNVPGGLQVHSCGRFNGTLLQSSGLSSGSGKCLGNDVAPPSQRPVQSVRHDEQPATPPGHPQIVHVSWLNEPAM